MDGFDKHSCLLGLSRHQARPWGPKGTCCRDTTPKTPSLEGCTGTFNKTTQSAVHGDYSMAMRRGTWPNLGQVGEVVTQFEGFYISQNSELTAKTSAP